MALFQYRAYAETGKLFHGVIDADSLEGAKDKLRIRDIAVVDVKLLQKKGKDLSLRGEQLLGFTRELSQLLQAGLPLYESLLTIEEKSRGRKEHPLFLDLCDQLKEGTSLSKALRRFPRVFDTVYLAMIEAAESSGELPLVFSRLTMLLESKEKLKKTLFAAAAYPLFLAVFCCALTFGLLVFAVPMMAELFEGRHMQPLTRCVFELSAFLKGNLEWLSLFLCFLIGMIFWLKRLPSFREKFYAVILKTPFIRIFISQAALTRFSYCLSMLLFSGLPLIDALRLSKYTLKMPLYEASIEIMEDKILEGEKLSQLLKKAPIFPPLLARMCAIGEETGELGKMFESFSKLTESNLERNLVKFTTFLQPALLIFLGAIVGLVILAVLLPLTDVQSFLHQ